MTKKKKIILITSILLIVSIIAFFMFTNIGRMYRDVTILMSTGKKTNIEGNFEELNEIEEELNNYDVYLTGEEHGTELSFKMQEYMARYFVEEQGVKYILLEMPVSEAELLNVYLQTGDTEILRNMVNYYKGTFGYSQNYYDLYKFYYEYNKQLPEDKKISFVGIDVEQNLLQTSDYIKYLIKDLGEPNEKIKDMVERIKKYSNYNDEFFFNDLNQSVIDNEKEYEEYLGKDFFNFKIVVKNISLNENNTAREAIMVKNFQDFYEKLPKGKYYGQLGWGHVYKLVRSEGTGGEGPINTFANSINNDYESLKGKVYSMMYLYMNSYYSKNGEEQKVQGKTINIPCIRGNGSSRLYTPENDKRVYEILKDRGWTREELGDVFFLLKDSKAATMFSGE